MRTLNEYMISAHFPDLGAASSIFVPVPDGGRLVRAEAALHAAIAGADAVLTLRNAGVALANGTITLAQAGSAAGDVAGCSPSSGHHFVEGSAIEVASDGGPAGSAAATLAFVIRR